MGHTAFAVIVHSLGRQQHFGKLQIFGGKAFADSACHSVFLSFPRSLMDPFFAPEPLETMFQPVSPEIAPGVDIRKDKNISSNCYSQSDFPQPVDTTVFH